MSVKTGTVIPDLAPADFRVTSDVSTSDDSHCVFGARSDTGATAMLSGDRPCQFARLSDDVWRVILSHSSFRALARLALTSSTLALRVQPAVLFKTHYPAVREYILATQATPEAIADALRYVELRYELTVADAHLKPGLLYLTEEDKSKLADMLLCPSIHDISTERGQLLCAILMRLSPLESIQLLTSYVENVRPWNIYSIVHQISRTLSRVQWTAEQLAQLARMMTLHMDEEPPNGVEQPSRAMVVIVILTDSWYRQSWGSRAQREAVLQAMHLPLMERAHALCLLRLFRWEFDHFQFDVRDDAGRPASARSLAALAVEEHWDVPTVVKVLKTIIHGEEEEHERLLSHLMTFDSGYRRHEPDHTCSMAFLGKWSDAVAVHTALGHEDQAAVLSCIQELSASSKKQLYLVVLGWVLPSLPAGFVRDVGRAWSSDAEEEKGEAQQTTPTPLVQRAEAMCHRHLFNEEWKGHYVLRPRNSAAVRRLVDLAVGQHSSAAVKMLEVIVDGEERNHDDMLEGSYEGLDYIRHEPEHACSRDFLRTWSDAVSLTTALGPNRHMALELRRLTPRGTIDGVAVLRCIQALPGSAKAQLFPIFLGWALPLLPADFVADVGREMQ